MGSECARPVEALAGESSIGERGLADLHCFQGVLVRGMGGGVRATCCNPQLISGLYVP